MGVLADIYVSNDDDAVGYDGQSHWPGTDRVQYKNFTILELSTLWTIIRECSWDVTLLQEFSCILVVQGGERLVHKLPAAMLMDLATIASDRIEGVSSRWAATEELCWTAKEARVVIDDLMQLARRAVDTGRSLFIWNCL